MLHILPYRQASLAASVFSLVAALTCAPIASAQTAPAASQPAAQAPASPPPVYTPTSLVAAPDTPRTRDGHPDFQGAVWATNYFPVFETSPMNAGLVVPETEAKKMVDMMVAGMLKSPDPNFKIDPEVGVIIGESAGLPIVRGERRTRLVVLPASGKVPLTLEARKELESSAPFGGGPMDNPEQRPPGERCLALSGQAPVSSILSYTRLRIVQTPTHVVIHGENGDEARIVPFAASHGSPATRSWYGDGIARWEGDTLVVETIRQPKETRSRGFDDFIVTPDSKVIERFTRLSKSELLYQYTVEDPAIYSGPWMAEYSFSAVSTGMYPSSCHEANYSLPNILSGACVIEARAGK